MGHGGHTSSLCLGQGRTTKRGIEGVFSALLADYNSNQCWPGGDGEEGVSDHPSGIFVA